MKKSFLFTLVIASACLSACSSDEESIADNNAAVEIKLSSITNNSMSRASIESNNAGVFSAEGISVFALASRKQKDGSKVNWSSTDEYACILNNKLFNAIPNTEKTVTNLVPVGTSYYYPLSDIYTYRFYGAYPSVSAENLSTSATQYKAKYTIDGTQDIIWGQSDDAGYSNKYFKNNPKAAAPNIAFKHLLTRLTFTCEPSGDYAKRLKEDPSVALFVKDVVVNNVPTEGNLIIADNENPANEGKIEFDKETGKDLYLKDENDATFSPIALKVNSDGTSNKVSVGGSIILPPSNQFSVTIVLVNKYGEEYVSCSKVLSPNDTSPFCSGKIYNVGLRVNSVTDTEVNTTATLNPWEFGDGGATDKENMENGHEYVDLGLPSGLKWATMNIGASIPEDFGDYFAWGETEPYYSEGQWETGKTGYNWFSYKWCNGSGKTLTKYCTSSNVGIVDNKKKLDILDDAAHANWSGSWRMPTNAEFNELRTKCTWAWTTQNGVNGSKVIGPNGNTIFLPSAGERDDVALWNQGGLGFYWSSTLATNNSGSAYTLRFGSGGVSSVYESRYRGHSVRAVCP